MPSSNDSSSLNEVEIALMSCAVEANGFSGRSLRKLPFLAFANYLQQTSSCASGLEFTHALKLTIEDERRARSEVALNASSQEQSQSHQEQMLGAAER
jgi:hypothetical protein